MRTVHLDLPELWTYLQTLLSYLNKQFQAKLTQQLGMKQHMHMSGAAQSRSSEFPCFCSYVIPGRGCSL